jgi:hypothetical protein
MQTLQKNVAGQVVVFSLFSGVTRIENPTLAVGDFKVALNAGAQNNVTTLPTTDGVGKVIWLPTAAETNANTVAFLARDVAGAEWDAQTLSFDTSLIPGVWSYARRTLTMPLHLLHSMLLGDKLELWRGDTLDLDLVGLGNLAAADDLWFTVKKQLGDADAAAEIQISLDGGLLAIAGAAATTPANGSITITDAALGNITVALTAVEMAKLDIDFTGYWDIQSLAGATVTTLTRGNAQVLGDSTRRII